MDPTIRLGRIRGIEIGANWSVLLIAALLTVGLAEGVLPTAAPHHLAAAYWVTGAVTALLFFAALLVHELSHAVVARRHGLEVRRITLWLLGGLAQTDSTSPDADTELKVGVIGPVVSLLIGVVAALLAFGVGQVSSMDLTAAALWWLAIINLVIGAFNLLPAFPLDGGRVLRAALWRLWGDEVRATVAAARVGRLFGYGIVAFGLMLFLAGALVDGIWFALIGWFLVAASGAESAATQQSHLLAGVTVGDVMSPDPVVVPGSTTVAELLHEYVLRHRHSAYPVLEPDGRLVGLVSLDAIRRLPLATRDATAVRAAAVPIAQVPICRPDDRLLDLLPRLAGPTTTRALVLDASGRLVGILTHADVVRVLNAAVAGVVDSSLNADLTGRQMPRCTLDGAMDLRFTPEEDAFRKEVRTYLDELLHGEFAVIRGRGGPGDEHAFFDERLAWERRLGADGWTCVGWPTEFGGRGLPLNQQVIYFEEYARAGGPGRLGHIGEGLIGPTLIHYGSPEQQQRFLPAIVARRRAVVPGLLRTRRRVRSGQRRHPSLARRRGVGDRRAEGLDVAGALERLVLPTGPHRS